MTTERVTWTYTHNLSTDDPERAMKYMAYTSMNAERLKQQAGVDNRGRKSTAGHVYAFSLAWHPEQTPDKQHMIDTSLSVLERLGLKDNHQAVMAAHQDEDHPHVHVICNLVNKENGRTASLSNDRLILSKWAEEYEKEHGKIYCDKRLENNQKRMELAQEQVKAERREQQQAYKEGHTQEKPEIGIVKHRQDKHERSALIQDLYNRSDNGKAFRAALQEEGFTLAKGDRRGFVLVDQDGKIHSLSRQLKGQRAEDLRNRLSDIEDLKSPKEIVKDMQSVDRHDYEIEQQNKELDEANRQKAAEERSASLEEKKENKSAVRKPVEERFRELGKQSGMDKLRDKIKERNEEKDPVELATTQSKRWFAIIDMDREDDAKIATLEHKLRQDHKFEELERKSLKLKEDLAKSDTFLGRRTGRYRELLIELESHESHFEQTKQRIQARVDELKRELIEKRPPELRSANDDNVEPPPNKEKSSNIADFEEAVKKKLNRQTKEEEFKERMRRNQKQQTQERDRDKGMEFDV